VTVSVTLINLLENDIEEDLVTLTKGEAGSSNGKHTKPELVALRTLEMQQAAIHIGVTDCIYGISPIMN
jgi:LmbE family N-acetylglucosaminyl deacetylase